MTSVRKRSGLGRWFGEKWVDLSRPKDGGGFEPCGRSDTSKGKYPKCVPAATAARMTPDEIRSAISRKRRAESSSDGDGKSPVMVPTFKDGRPSKRSRPVKRNRPLDAQLYAKVKSEARRRFDVYPSAYANGWLVQEYKRRGGRYLRASAAPDSTVLVCNSTVVFACKSKACAPPPVGSGGSTPSSGMSGIQEAWERSIDDRMAALNSKSNGKSAVMNRRAARAVDEYSADAYMMINPFLRHGLTPLRDSEVNAPESVQLLDHAFKAFGQTLAEPVVVYRGLQFEGDPTTIMGTDIATIGSVVQDNGYVSTSMKTNVAERFSEKTLYEKDYFEGMSSVTLNITLPKGSRVLSGGRNVEYELLLPRNSKFRVTGARRGKGSHIVVDMELIP